MFWRFYEMEFCFRNNETSAWKYVIQERMCCKWEELSEKGTMDVKMIGVRSGVTRGIIFWIFWRQMWIRKMVRTLGKFIDYGWWHGKWKISIFMNLEGEMIDKMRLLAIRGTISGLMNWKGRFIRLDGRFRLLDIWMEFLSTWRGRYVWGWIFKLVCGMTSLYHFELAKANC